MKAKPGYKQVKRRSGALRIIHWTNVLGMMAAIITGLYIADPYYQTFIADPAVDKYVMAWNRWVHFIFAIIFDVTSILIVYLTFFSRVDKAYKKVIPNKQNLVEFWEVFLNLITLNRRKEFSSEHSDSFNTTYFFIFHFLMIWMLLTGLQMYVHGLGSGISSIGAWWPWMLHLVTDWTLPVSSFLVGSTATGTNLMDVRIAHHTTMWLLITWVVFHIYYQFWRTIFWKEGDISIIVGGSKYVKIEDGEKN
ncbi:cytochrome b/b6 domain-containing protein [Sulfurimonas sp. SAG-AH-194-L11]|nr:cytochrome b/b6 domain-containing protein [Sulfurimonas sp. SAG-AH-194-L11]MDF1877335.1 cytochrome b/b6 domain-containing protein [Sulfurimonas sp. SAG-AH-194-L11]